MIVGAAVLQAACAQTPAAGPAAPSGQASKPAPAPAAAPAASAPVERDTAVLDRLKQMSAYLRTLKSFVVTAQTTTDEVLDSGQKIQFAGAVEYRFVSPDKLRAGVRSDRVWRDFYFDGKTLTQAAPRMDYYASVPVSGTVGQLVTRLANDYDIEMPMADLFMWGTNEDSVNNVTGAANIGPARVNGVDCDHFAMRQAGVDWQVWVQKGAQPLPRKMVITTTDQPQQPQYSAVLSWNLNAHPAASEFTYKPSKGAVKIELKKVAAN
ncbi:DUF2092 domain-containing protein [Variovorax sp. J22R133]|uniref:DUF2092 domain-containing protein n=1 Tax=Variovorax brevis TaxID=3053503 RepID=UPI0025775FAF|nr:DUF2092 domain-containing protein [Variovorax sp. J22R133]MDM0110606.1 DUF2092 domain-containing protein [Variovorax sp. J22R133]